MNTAVNEHEFAQNVYNDKNSSRNYRPRLSFYHANGKGTGSAVQFEVMPARSDLPGAVYLSLVQQKSIAGLDDKGERRHATFDWQNRVTVKLNFSDICQMLLVLRGQTSSIAEGKGLYHDSLNMTTIINMKRQTESFAGVALDVSRKIKDAEGQSDRVRIVFNDAEAFGVGAVLEQILGLIAFGIPRRSRRRVTSKRSETESSAI